MLHHDRARGWSGCDRVHMRTPGRPYCHLGAVTSSEKHRFCRSWPRPVLLGGLEKQANRAVLNSLLWVNSNEYGRNETLTLGFDRPVSKLWPRIWTHPTTQDLTLLAGCTSESSLSPMRPTHGPANRVSLVGGCLGTQQLRRVDPDFPSKYSDHNAGQPALNTVIVRPRI